MMMTFTRKRSLSLGSRYRCLLTFAVLLPALLSGVTAARAEAPIFDWAEVEGGTVEVEVEVDGIWKSPTPLTLNKDETQRYRLRLTKPLPAGEEGWWVRVHVNGAVRIDGFYPDGTERHDRNNKLADISWVPSVGWEFDSGDWESGQCQGQGGVQCVSKWRGVTITAYKDVETPIRFMHDVLDAQSECPDDLKGLGKLFVSTIGTDPPPPPPPLLPSAVTVSVASATAMEGDAVSFPVTLSGAAESDTVLGWTTAAGTATSGTGLHRGDRGDADDRGGGHDRDADGGDGGRHAGGGRRDVHGDDYRDDAAIRCDPGQGDGDGDDHRRRERQWRERREWWQRW